MWRTEVVTRQKLSLPRRLYHGPSFPVPSCPMWFLAFLRSMADMFRVCFSLWAREEACTGAPWIVNTNNIGVHWQRETFGRIQHDRGPTEANTDHNITRQSPRKVEHNPIQVPKKLVNSFVVPVTVSLQCDCVSPCL